MTVESLVKKYNTSHAFITFALHEWTMEGLHRRGIIEELKANHPNGSKFQARRELARQLREDIETLATSTLTPY